jgi:SWI/SNF-related matrix-associated actin-dependent regulator of chromatin subfamily A-like protein 1
MPLDPLYPFQEDGVRHLVAGGKFSFLGDEPGLGKSRQALEAARRLGARKITILCPAIAKVSWAKELQKWGASTATVVLHSYDKVGLAANRALRRELEKLTSDVVILDEAHYLKSRAANRTKAVYGPRCMGTGIVANAKKVIGLSGTLAPNHYGELWTHLHASGIYPGTLQQFEDRFCVVKDTDYGRQIVGSKNGAELREVLKGVYLGRLKRNVLTDLPPLRFVDEPLDSALVQSPEALTSLNDKLSEGRTELEFEAALVTIPPSHIATERRALGLAKIEAVAQWAENLGAKKLVLFGYHPEVIEKLSARLIEMGPVHVHGGTSHQSRVAAVDRFQSDPTCRVFVGQLQAAGTAITLTAASDVAIFEASWTPGENYQAACRVHRIGQNDGVLCRFLYVPGTIDQRIARVYSRKAQELSDLFE